MGKREKTGDALKCRKIITKLQSAVFHTNAEIVIRTSKFIFIFTIVTQQKEATPWGSSRLVTAL
jgi:hypothetical protein